MMLRKLHMSITTLSALSLMTAGVLTVSASAPAMAAQQVNAPVTLEHITTDNAITLTGEDSAPELVCLGKTPQANYEVGYKFTMDLADLKAKWKSVVDSWRTVPHLTLTDLDVVGDLALAVSLPEDVDVTADSYTAEAYAQAFAAANADSPLLQFLKVHDVQVEDKTLTLRFKLPQETKSGKVTEAFDAVDTLVFPTLDNTLYVSAANVEKNAVAKSSIELAGAKLTGFIDVPEIQHLIFDEVKAKLPLNASGSAKSTVTLGAKIKPYMEIVHKAKDAGSSPALPAGIKALDKTAERAVGEDPDALPEAPEAGKLKLETEEGTWTFENYTAEKSGVCGKRVFTGLWAWTPKAEDKEPTPDAPSDPGTDVPSKPDVNAPDGDKPSEPGNDAPGGSTPDDEAPGTEAPGGSDSGTDAPGGSTPDDEAPGTEAPGGSDSGTDAPGGSTPDDKAPGTDAPGGDTQPAPGDKEPSAPGGNEPSNPGDKEPSTPGDKEPSTPGGKEPSNPGDKVPGDSSQSDPKGDSLKPKDALKQTVAPSAPRVVVGKEIVFTAAGFLPGSDVTFKVYSTEVVVGTVKADKDGKASIKWTVPADFATGEHKVVALNDKAQRAESSFIVEAPAQAQSAAPKAKAALAATGATTEALIALSMMGALGGAAAYANAARRRS